MSLLNWIALLMSFKYSNLIGVVLGGENFFNLMNIYWKTIINCVIHRKYSKSITYNATPLLLLTL